MGRLRFKALRVGNIEDYIIYDLPGRSYDRLIDALRQVRETRQFPDTYAKELEDAHKQACHYARSQLWKNLMLWSIEYKKVKLVPQPEEVIQALRIKLKMEELRKLRNAEKELKNENRELMKQVTEKSNTLKKVSEKVTADLVQLKEATSMAVAMPVDDFHGVMDTLMVYKPE
ncbi:hypothetical protein DFQ29_006097 [Apophysomyces sp. BC1021]|nr:hypothetical protein DFQ29_006097 [Apophysomyces sp. BC1021]